MKKDIYCNLKCGRPGGPVTDKPQPKHGDGITCCLPWTPTKMNLVLRMYSNKNKNGKQDNGKVFYFIKYNQMSYSDQNSD